MSVHRKARRLTLLTGRIEAAFERKEVYLRKWSHSDTALAAIFRRSTKTTRAITHLARLGFGTDALALSRSLIDSWITVRWMTNRDSEARSRQFWGFQLRQRDRLSE